MLIHSTWKLSAEKSHRPSRLPPENQKLLERDSHLLYSLPGSKLDGQTSLLFDEIISRIRLSRKQCQVESSKHF